MFNIFVYICLSLASIFVVANATSVNFKEVIFEYITDYQRIKAINQSNNECIGGISTHIELTGEIDQNIVLIIERLLSQLEKCKSQSGIDKSIVIYLNSKGGRAHDGVKLGRLFRKHKVEALVRVDQLCASACAFAFVGAKHHSIGRGAELLFHAPFKKELFGVSCENRVNSEWLKSYFIEMLNEEQGEALFNKTMSLCDSSDGWLVNIENSSIFNIVN